MTEICNNIGFIVTVEAPINIALIKYWGKRNEVTLSFVNNLFVF